MQKTIIIVPCYNEEKRLNTLAFSDFVRVYPDIDFMFVNDGSTDNTRRVIQEFCKKFPNNMFFLDLDKNSGKAEAVRKGVLKALSENKYEFIGFWDADLATPLSEISFFLEVAKKKSAKIIMGSRLQRLGSIVIRKKSRHYLGRIFSTFASIILKLPVYDTQCGAKLFHSTICDIFNESFCTKWLFDIELLARYRNTYGIEQTLVSVVEVPVNKWEEVSGSKLKLSYMLKVPFELIKIRNKYN